MSPTNNFNFDEFAELYKNDPAKFEQKRSELIESEIRKYPVESRSKLRILQMECDAIHYSKDPLDATIELTKMMVKSLKNLQTEISKL